MELPVINILPFEGGGSSPVQYELTHGGREYYVRYRHSWLSIDIDDVAVFSQLLAPEAADDGDWSDEETTVYLSAISRAIRIDDVPGLKLPTKIEARAHPDYRKGPQPVYLANRLNCAQGHAHGEACFREERVAARDVAAWNLRHAADVAAWKIYFKRGG